MQQSKDSERATRENEWAGWMRAGLKGDEAAYRSLLKALTPVLRAQIRGGLARWGAGSADVEDILQEVLLAIHLKRQTWMTDQPLLPWLNAIARYKLIDSMRRRGRRGEVPIEGLADILPVAADDVSQSRNELERLVGRLDGRAGAIVKAISLDGDDVDDVASREHMTPGAVRVALHRGLRKLSSLYREDGR